METLITLDCSKYSVEIVDIIKIFKRAGWSIYNTQKKIEYLPLDDNGMFNWQCEYLKEENFYGMLNQMDETMCKGINLFFMNGNEVITFLAHDTRQIILGLNINRRIMKNGQTDMVWYIENVIYKLKDLGMRIVSYTIEEFED